VGGGSCTSHFSFLDPPRIYAAHHGPVMTHGAGLVGNVSFQAPDSFNSLIFRRPEFSWHAYVAVTRGMSVINTINCIVITACMSFCHSLESAAQCGPHPPAAPSLRHCPNFKMIGHWKLKLVCTFLLAGS